MWKIVGCGVLVCALLAGQETRPVQAQGKETARLMAEKLKQSQKLLEGIAISDFRKIAASADELIQLSKTEEWMQLKTPRFELYSNEFRRAAEALVQKAKTKNIDGTTLAFFEMTMSCVRCHQYVRETRDARLPRSPDDAFLARHDGETPPTR